MVIYTLYSFPPIRLKKEVYGRAKADAFGGPCIPAMGIFALLF